MGKSLNYFKNYEIKFDEAFCVHYVQYLEGDSFDLSYESISVLTDLLEHFGVQIPFYDSDCLISNQPLRLLDPELVSAGCILAIGLLQQETNPIIYVFDEEKEPLWAENSDAFEKNHSLRILLQRILVLSEQGYHFTFDDE